MCWYLRERIDVRERGARIRDPTMECITRPPAILIVDDEPDMLALLDYFVHKVVPTYDIVTVSDAESALSQLAYRTVPLMITDYLMPGMNGLQLMAAVKAASPPRM
jgi:DNA-binding NtrC family response regulator